MGKRKVDLEFEPLWEVNKNGTVKVLCMFYGKDRFQFSKYLPVEGVKYHWVPRYNPITLECIGDDLFVDEGYIILEDLQETYIAQGIPPLIYKEENPIEVRQL